MSNGNLNIGDHSAFTLNRDNPDAYRVIYLFKAPAAGSISITYHVCEVQNADEFDRDNCVTFPGGFTTQVLIDADTELELADAKETGEATYTWDNLVVATGEDPQPGDQPLSAASRSLEPRRVPGAVTRDLGRAAGEVDDGRR